MSSENLNKIEITVILLRIKSIYHLQLEDVREIDLMAIFETFVIRPVASSTIGRAHIHIFMYSDHKNNRFQKKLIVQNTNMNMSPPPQLSSWLRPCL